MIKSETCISFQNIFLFHLTNLQNQTTSAELVAISPYGASISASSEK